MKNTLIRSFSIILLLLFGVQCTFLEDRFGYLFNEPFVLDLEGIQARGTIRAAVDNNSTSYYIYRGRRMGYEYELLKDLEKKLGVQVEFVVVSDIESAFDLLEEGKVDLIAMNLEQNPDRAERAFFSQSLGTMSTALVGLKSLDTPVSWELLGNDTVFVRKGTVYKSQLEKMKDSLGLQFIILESSAQEETLIDEVADRQIKWTVADKNIAQANLTYYCLLYTSDAADE